MLLHALPPYQMEALPPIALCLCSWTIQGPQVLPNLLIIGSDGCTTLISRNQEVEAGGERRDLETLVAASAAGAVGGSWGGGEEEAEAGLDT